jgi:hypothetical protein
MSDVAIALSAATSVTRDAILALSSDHLYALEQAGEIARDVLDERIIAWTEEGWSQRRPPRLPHKTPYRLFRLLSRAPNTTLTFPRMAGTCCQKCH